MVFKPGQFEIKKEADRVSETRILKVEAPFSTTIQEFSIPKIKRDGEGDYQAVKKKFGALAATDTDRKARTQKDSRFTINPLLRDPLSIEQEERKIIEEKVQARVAAIAAEARASAVNDGYQEGLKKGYEEAYKRFRLDGAERMKKLDEFLASCEGAKEEIFRANERFLIEMVYRIGRMVTLKELSTDKDYVLRVARDLLERVGVRENIGIRVHPEEAASIQMLREGLEKSLGALKNVNIEVSKEVKRGGCVVETEWNKIDATVETQLAGIYDSLIGDHESRTEGAGEGASGAGEE